MNVGHLLFGFRGRINRAKFWLAALIYFIVVGVATAVAFTFESFDWVTVAMVIILVALISSVAVGIKRLHDRDKSAWWLAFFYLAPAALSAISYHLLGGSDPDGGGIPAQVLGFAGLAINIWMLVELGCLRGTIGHNQYGADPVAPLPAPQRALR